MRIAKALLIGSVAGAAHILLPTIEHWGLVQSATPSFSITRSALALTSLTITFLSLRVLFHIWKSYLLQPIPASIALLAAAFGYYIVSLHWLGEAFLADHQTYTVRAAIGLFGCMAIFVPWWGLAGGVSALAVRAGISPAVAFTVAFSMADMMLGDWIYEIPLAPISFALLDTPLDFLFGLLGQHGATFMLVAAATLPNSVQRLFLPILTAVMTLLLIVPQQPLPDYTSDAPRITLIQPLADPTDPKGVFDNDAAAIKQMTSLLREAGRYGTSMIALPEAAIPVDISDSPSTASSVFSALDTSTLLVAGFHRARADDPTDPASLRPVNSSGIFNQAGRPRILYDKSHLVPFGEYMPRAFAAIGYDVMAGPPGGFAAGDGMGVYTAPDGSAFSLAICYEVILSGPVSRETTGADWILNQSSERMFGYTIAPRLLMGYTRIRAVETGIPIYRAVMSGGTSAIDSSGLVRAEIQTGTSGVLPAPTLPSRPTVFRHTGYWPLYAIWILAIVAGVSRRPRKSKCKWKRVSMTDHGSLKAFQCTHCQEIGYRTIGKPTCLKGVSSRPL